MPTTDAHHMGLSPWARVCGAGTCAPREQVPWGRSLSHLFLAGREQIWAQTERMNDFDAWLRGVKRTMPRLSLRNLAISGAIVLAIAVPIVAGLPRAEGWTRFVAFFILVVMNSAIALWL